MEEWLGKHWHRFISRFGEQAYRDATVRLEDEHKTLSILLRAFGGSNGTSISAAPAQRHKGHRSWLQRVAGNHTHVPLAWRDHEALHLPHELAVFPDRQLNHELYHWLTALAVAPHAADSDWLQGNQQKTLWVLQHFQGLRPLYERLCTAHLSMRPKLSSLKGDEKILEHAIRQGMLNPEIMFDTSVSVKTRFQPVYLWMHPHPPSSQPPSQATSDTDDDALSQAVPEDGRQEHKYRAERTEMPEGKDGMLAMRWENIFSWGEYLKVNRCSDEEKDPDAGELARDMELLHVGRDGQTSSSRIQLDLDLPPAAYDDLPIRAPITLPEWDWRKQKMVMDHCRVQTMLPRKATPSALPAHLEIPAKRLRTQLSNLRHQRQWMHAQMQGSEIDLAAYVDFYTARHSGQVCEEGALYKQLVPQQRDLATLLLADLSLSTDAAINEGQRIIDIIRDSLLLFAEALSHCGDRYALCGFSSRRREQVRYYELKSFDGNYNDFIRGRIQALKPGYYTRMGAAIRMACRQLQQQKVQNRLLILLTDGKPNDLDHYEGRHGVEDTRMAIKEARSQGLLPFCMTIDKEGADYLPYLFGSHGFVVVQRPEQLPNKLLQLYAQISHV